MTPEQHTATWQSAALQPSGLNSPQARKVIACEMREMAALVESGELSLVEGEMLFGSHAKVTGYSIQLSATPEAPVIEG